jgi:hypothetical protein
VCREECALLRTDLWVVVVWIQIERVDVNGVSTRLRRGTSWAACGGAVGTHQCL